jgi:hypothetical protein
LVDISDIQTDVEYGVYRMAFDGDFTHSFAYFQGVS